MFNWWFIVVQALWIAGLAILLAAISFASYQAQVQTLSWRAVLARPVYQAFMTVGGILFFAGLAAADDRWWATMLFAALAGLTLILFLYNRRVSLKQ